MNKGSRCIPPTTSSVCQRSNRRKQRRPSFTGEVVTDILRQTEEERYCVLFALCASTGLRFGEALGIFAVSWAVFPSAY